VRGVLLGLAIAGLVLSCAKKPIAPPEWSTHMEKMQVINGLWLQIRDMRGDLKMTLDPSPAAIADIQYIKNVKEVKKVCPDTQAVAPVCEDTCIIAGQICENAESICSIADELGKDDTHAQDKCTSAKASCREAKQRCCNCNAKPPVSDK
jgi:hypothetical protein